MGASYWPPGADEGAALCAAPSAGSKPGGFEGLAPVGEAVHAQRFAAPERPDVGPVALHRDAALLATADQTSYDHHPVTGIEVLLRLEANLVPVLGEAFDVLPDLID